VGHVTLDEKIVQLSDGSLLHSADIAEKIALLPGCNILEKEYRERVDQDPTPHRHHYYDVYFRKLRAREDCEPASPSMGAVRSSEDRARDRAEVKKDFSPEVEMTSRTFWL
jgi:hypothetical protein